MKFIEMLHNIFKGGFSNRVNNFNSPSDFHDNTEGKNIFSSTTKYLQFQFMLMQKFTTMTYNRVINFSNDNNRDT